MYKWNYWCPISLIYKSGLKQDCRSCPVRCCFPLSSLSWMVLTLSLRCKNLVYITNFNKACNSNTILLCYNFASASFFRSVISKECFQQPAFSCMQPDLSGRKQAVWRKICIVYMNVACRREKQMLWSVTVSASPLQDCNVLEVCHAKVEVVCLCGACLF